MGANMDRSGSCIVCITGTDTGIAFGGSIEWLAAGLVALGVPTEEAIATITSSVDGRSRRSTLTVRVCAKCARKSALSVTPALIYVGGQIPCISEPVR